MKNSEIKIKDICSYRNLWMGIAIVWVMLFHSSLLVAYPMDFLKNIGYGGVDIFFFASGIGCYYSFDKDKDAFGFITRRAKRILPTYFMFIIPWCFVKNWGGKITLREALGNLLFLQYMTGLGNAFNWYICGMWVMYLITPYLAGLVGANRERKNEVLILTMFLIATIPFWASRDLIIIVTRIPIFTMGMFMEKRAVEDKNLKRPEFWLVLTEMFIGIILLYMGIIRFSAGIMWDYGFYWYPFIFITPGICIVISLVAIKLEGNRNIFVKVFQSLGNLSFELYLVHILIFEYACKVITTKSVLMNNIAWIGTFPVTITVSVMLKKIMRIVVDKGGRLWKMKS